MISFLLGKLYKPMHASPHRNTQNHHHTVQSDFLRMVRYTCIIQVLFMYK